jgi:hypothetical protein
MKKIHLVTFNFAEKKKKNAANTTKTKRKEKKREPHATIQMKIYITYFNIEHKFLSRT